MKPPDNEPLPDRENHRLAVLGDLTAMVAHEFNNILNNISLQLAVMEQKELPADLHSDVAVIRQAARNATSMVKQLQQFSQHRAAPLEMVDLNAVVERVVARQPNALALHLAPSLPPVKANVRDLERMVDLLLTSSAEALVPEAIAITLQTEALPDRVRLRLTDRGPQVNGEDLRRFFQPFAVLRRGSDGIARPYARPSSAASKAPFTPRIIRKAA